MAEVLGLFVNALRTTLESNREASEGEACERLALLFLLAPISHVSTKEDTVMHRPKLIVTHDDARRLNALLEGPATAASPIAPLLEEELTRAELVESDAIASNVVTMNSRVVCRDEQSGHEQEVELVYPHEADLHRARVSVLAPIGAALLGLSTGEAIDWPLPGGRMARVRVVSVPFQPEAHRRAVS
jgi:regulator of nucleoside diphosphate kinase